MMQKQAQAVFHDIYGYHEVFFYQTIYFKLLLVLFCIIFFYGVYYLFKKRKKRKKEPWDWALYKIAGINIEACETKKDFKKLYFDVTTILKQYFHKRYGWKTASKTDEELIAYLKKQKFDEKLLDELKKMLEGSVWIKFANQDVIKTQAQKDIKTSVAIIQKTIPHDIHSESCDVKGKKK